LAAIPFLGADGPAAVVSADQDLRVALLGGTTVGAQTVIRFYVLHCLVLPLCVGLLLVLHFWRVRKDGFHGSL
jgi:quinol-cytochrome oxidoreductase complex cytochrome b subunit